MKKIIFIFAFIILATSFLFSAGVVDPNCATPSGNVTNDAKLTISCPSITFVCAGTVFINLVAGGDPASCVTVWNIDNWGQNGTFTVTTPSPAGIYTITPPSGGAAADIVVSTGTMTPSGLRSNGGDGKWKFDQSRPLCNAHATLTYSCSVRALAGATQGTYTVTFEQDFIAN